jgi:hypothetical protein
MQCMQMNTSFWTRSDLRAGAAGTILYTAEKPVSNQVSPWTWLHLRASSGSTESETVQADQIRRQSIMYAASVRVNLQ